MANLAESTIQGAMIRNHQTREEAIAWLRVPAGDVERFRKSGSCRKSWGTSEIRHHLTTSRAALAAQYAPQKQAS